MGDSYIIAIDFGTAYSGYAYTVTSKEDQIDPVLKSWGKELGLETPKTPTCILFNEEEEFLNFGYEAKTAYINMRGEEAKNHYFFEAFKMALYGAKLNKDVTITAANGKSMNALKVFTSALSYLKENALTTISTKAGKTFIASDFTWVLTVPAIWDPSAKQFMREAATRVTTFPLETVQGASWHGGSIKITKEKMKSFFDESLNGISKSLREILNEDFNIQFILLVGGYAESKILRFHIKSEFSHQCKVLCPFRAQEAIVKGAVQFGRNPEVVASRKSAFTYGIATCQSFDKSKHKAEKKFTTGEDDFCNDIFMKLVEIDEGVDWNETKEHIFNPVSADQTAMNLRFYRTERKNAKYVDEWGIEDVASFFVNMPDTTQGVKREVRLEIRFGSTEITATATDLVSGCGRNSSIIVHIAECLWLSEF
uniref:Heat shock protein family A (Hsp70) member 12A.2 n=1 Tax=Seriola lalandi dorsalis TaxID=1841481 RepID=A0A3B4YFI2_SERLL